MIFAFSMMSSGHDQTSPFPAIRNMLLFRKTLESWRLPGYVARYRIIRFSPNDSLCVHIVLLLTRKIKILLSFCNALIPIWVPSIALTVCRILQLQYSLNLLIALALSFLEDSSSMKSAPCDKGSSQKSWVILTAVDLATSNVLPVLRYESPVASLQKAIATRFSTGIALQNFVSCFEMFPSTKLTISTKVLGYMRKSFLNDSRKCSSLRFSQNYENQVSFRFPDQYVFIPISCCSLFLLALTTWWHVKMSLIIFRFGCCCFRLIKFLAASRVKNFFFASIFM